MGSASVAAGLGVKFESLIRQPSHSWAFASFLPGQSRAARKSQIERMDCVPGGCLERRRRDIFGDLLLRSYRDRNDFIDRPCCLAAPWPAGGKTTAPVRFNNCILTKNKNTHPSKMKPRAPLKPFLLEA